MVKVEPVGYALRGEQAVVPFEHGVDVGQPTLIEVVCTTFAEGIRKRLKSLQAFGAGFMYRRIIALAHRRLALGRRYQGGEEIPLFIDVPGHALGVALGLDRQ